jgi:Ca-activated chloride channel family protein
MRQPLRALTSALVLICALLPSYGQNAAKPPAPAIVVGSENVLVRVSVADTLNRYIAGLQKEHFQLLEDRVPQAIRQFASQGTPISMGIIFDLSGGMRDSLSAVIQTIGRLRNSGRAGDEYFLLTFNQPTYAPQDTGLSLLLEEDAFSLPNRLPALHAAISKGLDSLRKGKNEKKVLVLITSRSYSTRLNSPWEAWEYTKQSEVQIYSINDGRWSIPPAIPIVRTSEVREFFPGSQNDLPYYLELTRTEVRDQYILGYSPTNRLHDGKWRKIEIKLTPPQGLPKLTVIARDGYFAPRD